jgi:hypothetical protein
LVNDLIMQLEGLTSDKFEFRLNSKVYCFLSLLTVARLIIIPSMTLLVAAFKVNSDYPILPFYT